MVESWRRQSWGSPSFPILRGPPGREVLSAVTAAVRWPGYGPWLFGFVHSPHFLRVIANISSVPARPFSSVPSRGFWASLCLRRPPSLLSAFSQAHPFLCLLNCHQWRVCLLSIRIPLTLGWLQWSRHSSLCNFISESRPLQNQALSFSIYRHTYKGTKI